MKTCPECGIATTNMHDHVCDHSAVVNWQVGKLNGEFEQMSSQLYRWRTFTRWMATPSGRFEQFWIHWNH